MFQEGKHLTDWKKIGEICQDQDGPERAILGLGKFPDVSVTRILVSESTPQSLVSTITELGVERPMAMILCNAGVCRSQLVAEYLTRKHKGLVHLTRANVDDEGEVKGCGNRYLDHHDLAVSGKGLFIDHDELTVYKNVAIRTEGLGPIDLLVLCFAPEHERIGDRGTLTRVASILQEQMEAIGRMEYPLHIIWLEGTEDDFEKWFPTSV